MDLPDDLDEYLRGDSTLSRQYRRESSPAPPHALDRRVLRLSREAQGSAQRLMQCLAPLAFAASVLLSVALVLAIVFGPQTTKRVEEPLHLVRVAARADVPRDAPLQRKLRLYGNDPQQHLRAPGLARRHRHAPPRRTQHRSGRGISPLPQRLPRLHRNRGRRRLERRARDPAMSPTPPR